MIGTVWQQAILAAARLMAGTVTKDTPTERWTTDLRERAKRFEAVLKEGSK
jgi:hypothetical protein